MVGLEMGVSFDVEYTPEKKLLECCASNKDSAK
jgi:hypothetical protein